MTRRTPPAPPTTERADRPGRSETLAFIGRIAAGVVSGAVRAVVGWLLDH
ncbi:MULTISPECIES: hypothetical protein [unclassified Streptomyces]